MRRVRAILCAAALALLLILALTGCNDVGESDRPPETSIEELENGPLRLKVGDAKISPALPGSSPVDRPRVADSEGSAAQQQLDMLLEVWNLIELEYYKKDALDRQRMVHGAIRGLLDSLGDDEATFSDPPTSKVSQDDMRGSFDGIGVTVEVKAKRLVVVAPIDGSPAARAGLRAGDVIVRINERDAAGMSLPEAVSLIRGRRGSVVRLGIERDGEAQPLAIDVVRDAINVVTVKSYMFDGNIGYLKVSQFSESTLGTLEQHLEGLMDKKPRALIVDLRNNPGGMLGPAVGVASQFVGQGVVLHEKQSATDEVPILAQPGGLATKIPVFALVNRGTASAAEVVAGALQDSGRGLLIGERTFGKDTMQSVHELADGSTVSITVARWSTPKKRQIAGSGLTPDVVIPLTDDDARAGRDTQLERALAMARNGE